MPPVSFPTITAGSISGANPAVPYEEDEVTRIIQDDVNEAQYKRIRNWTVAELREWILDEKTSGADIRKLSRGLTSEMVAAVCKLMSNLDLIYAANKITVTAPQILAAMSGTYALLNRIYLHNVYKM